MKKILTYITQEESNKCLELESLRCTYKTLLSIDGYELNKDEINEKLNEVNRKIDDLWYDIAEKYRIPVHADKKMKIDVEDYYIYIEE